LSESATALQRLLVDGHFPSANDVIADRVRQLILGPQVLSRNLPELEEEAFRSLLARLITPDGILGGSAMAEALTSRFGRRFSNQGKTEGTGKALFGLADMLRDRAYRIRYLLMMATTETGSAHVVTIGQSLLDMINEAPDIHNFCYYRLTPIKKLTIITDLMRRIGGSVLDEQYTAPMLHRLDQLLVLFIERDKLVEKLDDPGHPLNRRAVRLVKFCGSGALLEGEALNVVRNRVIELLRRPRFVEEFTSGITDPRESERTIREFRQLLANSGFSAP
ncbi:MAG: hypothetical protein HQL37_14580, partial [Alphaproteobacteria bacterium]|nr:hypothetical protein [Alphaproteobacteria bacterium]